MLSERADRQVLRLLNRATTNLRSINSAQNSSGQYLYRHADSHDQQQRLTCFGEPNGQALPGGSGRGPWSDIACRTSTWLAPSSSRYPPARLRILALSAECFAMSLRSTLTCACRRTPGAVRRIVTPHPRDHGRCGHHAARGRRQRGEHQAALGRPTSTRPAAASWTGPSRRTSIRELSSRRQHSVNIAAHICLRHSSGNCL